jgi:hypothetical protein
MAEEKATLAFHLRSGFVECTEADAVVELGGREREGESKHKYLTPSTADELDKARAIVVFMAATIWLLITQQIPGKPCATFYIMYDW